MPHLRVCCANIAPPRKAWDCCRQVHPGVIFLPHESGLSRASENGDVHATMMEEVDMKNSLSTRSAADAGKIVRPACPECAEQQFASTVSVHVASSEVRHWWSCENCGHEFMTVVKLRKSKSRRPALS
jgi:RNase P subunit RPR2